MAEMVRITVIQEGLDKGCEDIFCDVMEKRLSRERSKVALICPTSLRSHCQRNWKIQILA